MYISAKMEQFSMAYLKCIAAQVGLAHAIPSVDCGVDVSLIASGHKNGANASIIDIQLKCTTKNTVNKQIKNGIIHYPLKLKNYHDLRKAEVVAPRYLMLLIVPDDETIWTQHLDDSLILSHTCYWQSLRFAPATDNQYNVTVQIPMEQTVTNQSLSDLMDEASKGECA